MNLKQFLLDPGGPRNLCILKRGGLKLREVISFDDTVPLPAKPAKRKSARGARK